MDDESLHACECRQLLSLHSVMMFVDKDISLRETLSALIEC